MGAERLVERAAPAAGREHGDPRASSGRVSGGGGGEERAGDDPRIGATDG